MDRKRAIDRRAAIGAVALLAVLIVSSFLYRQATAPSVAEDASVPARAGNALPSSIEVADTEALREQGLSARDSLGDDSGMLFVFPASGLHGFWMKDMRFSIDMLWLDDAGAIVHVVSNAAPETYPEIFTPPAPARYVLEVPAGYTARRGWGIGTVLDLGAYQEEN
ncbi:MAG TPA: DUF192 domain-containing protein [Candidatus Paceibacterota bacterium]|nr:DUF192 domain-containing protein [Candidatus Paceibacterota bacterium]